MKLKQYQVDAFATRVFEGNPAAVCPLDHWLDDSLLQAIANENNLSETAFFVPAEKGFQLRCFTPVAEVDLFGHATLATAHVLFDILGHAEMLAEDLEHLAVGHPLPLDAQVEVFALAAGLVKRKLIDEKVLGPFLDCA